MNERISNLAKGVIEPGTSRICSKYRVYSSHIRAVLTIFWWRDEAPSSSWYDCAVRSPGWPLRRHDSNR